MEDVINGNDRMNFITVAFLSETASKRIKELTDKHVEGARKKNYVVSAFISKVGE